jgi:thymidylate synthase
MSRNLTDALLTVLSDIEEQGTVVAARGSEQREILSALVTMERPTERVLTIPGRNNNIFAQIAETLWVLAGRDDLAYLSRYLPRAADFSDDGATWRAAYGPRLRAWAGEVDQLHQVRMRLTEDPHTKRAVATIFDPARDYVETLDVPCNNWLHFLHRDGLLHLHVAVRANDAIWGFSGINTFEWSVLHELMATTMGWKVGKLSWFVGTLHIYERHFETARQILRQRGIRSPYEFGIESPPITIGLDQLDDTLQQVFVVDELAHRGDHFGARVENKAIDDPFFSAAATMLRAHAAYNGGTGRTDALAVLDELPTCDFRIGGIEFLSRKLGPGELGDLRPGEADYFNYYWAMRDAATLLPV